MAKPQPGTGCIKGTVRLWLSLRYERRTTYLPLRDVPVTLTGGPKPVDGSTNADGEFCFEGLEIGLEYTLIFLSKLDLDGDGFPEFRLVLGESEWCEQVVDPETGEMTQCEVKVWVSEVGDCEDETGPCEKVDAVYEVFDAESLLLDAMEDFRAIRNAVDDLANYPPPPAAVAGVPGVGAAPSLDGAALEAVVHSAFAEVLGVPPRDFEAIQRALSQRFERKEVAGGRIVYEWKPGALVVETLFGAVKLTGNQARLFQPAQHYLEDSQALLDEMVPLCLDADANLISVQKALVLDLIHDIVAEFGREQEPRPVFVEKLFFALDGEVGALEDALCYNRAEIIDLGDEEQRTHGLMLRDNIEALRDAWNRYLTPSEEEKHLILGAQFRMLSRSLASVAESAQKVRTMLASVRFGPAEQRTVKVLAGQSMTVDDLLSMVEQFATVRARKFIQEGQSRGAGAALPLLGQLRDLSEEASELQIPPPFNLGRVQGAFAELATGLQIVIESASKLVSEQMPAEEAETAE